MNALLDSCHLEAHLWILTDFGSISLMRAVMMLIKVEIVEQQPFLQTIINTALNDILASSKGM